MSQLKQLVDELKDLINEMKEEESIAKASGNSLHANGLAQARVLLEMKLEKHGVARSTTIDTESRSLI